MKSETQLAAQRRRRKQMFLMRQADPQAKASALRIWHIRRALGMTQRDFAFYLRVAINTLSNWERGNTLPSPLAEQAIRHVATEHGLDLHTMRRFDDD